MSEGHRHQIQPAIVKRLKRASGHLQNVIEMIEKQRTCLEIAQQLHAVEKAVAAAKQILIHEHLDHCLDHALQSKPRATQQALAEFKDITKYL